MGDNSVERRARALFRRLPRPTDMHETGDTFRFRKTDRRPEASIVGAPFGEPGRSVSKRVGRDDQRHADSARRKNLLPFRDFGVRRGPRDHCDDQRRARKARQFRLSAGFVQPGIVEELDFEGEAARTFATAALEYEKAPRRSLP